VLTLGRGGGVVLEVVTTGVAAPRGLVTGTVGAAVLSTTGASTAVRSSKPNPDNANNPTAVTPTTAVPKTTAPRTLTAARTQ
jgi:hypothetical protein